MQIGGEPLDLGSWESNDSTATPGLWGFQVRREPHRSRTRVSNENKGADDGDDYAESWISIGSLGSYSQYGMASKHNRQYSRGDSHATAAIETVTDGMESRA